MKKINLFYILGVSFVFLLSGCVVRTYKVTKDRIDQDLAEGNRGYVGGEMPSSAAEELAERESTRTNTRIQRVIEVELHSPIKFEKAPQAKPEAKPLTEEGIAEDQDLEGNRGFITRSEAPEITQPVSMQKYTVQKNDTLQKISEKFYGTTKNWVKIYDANKDVLKGPNKIYPGQVINIPTESLKETKENLK